MPFNTATRQRGLTLIESLVSLVIFSLGILGLIALQATAINMSTDAKYRADAAFLADQIIGIISVSDSTTLASFAHKPSGTPCLPSGTASSNASVTSWIAQVNSVFQGAAPLEQITVDVANRVVTVALCWKQKDAEQHFHSVTTQIQWQ